MLQSKLFTKTKKEAPSDEVSRNAELLIRAGYIYKEMAGVYTFLPLGLRVLNNITKIVREEMNAIGGQEMLLSALQDRSLWEKTDRWSDDMVDNWFKTELKAGGTTGLGITHEEPLTRIMSEYISSYRDLPTSAYQFQTKFRNEMRAKSGIMRGREFLMKDLYSFSKNEEEHQAFYELSKIAYKKVYQRLGIGHLTYITFASGGIFAKYSHEFQTISSAGEDTIYVDEEKGIAINKEVYTDEVIENLGLDKSKLVEQRAIEVGNIFTLGTRFSNALGLNFNDENGNSNPVFMGSYGIGVSRLLGTIVETLSDDNGIIWPESIAPFQVHLLALGEDESVKAKATEVYEKLIAQGVEVLFDDRTGISAGEKFADADLLGMPLRAVISKRSLEESGVEIKKRTEEKGRVVSVDEFMNLLVANS
ncbi:MAG: prolyl-tRNA synthetase [Patescibacteria group bacterium]|jgi:prolyl-tRNA synthetase|nr:prolyl-tRNA synthetase [Patescibacteria group bacterium]MDQ5961817.1 prolyl-tRNA synthetase [Patescibacteria group bacterium]